MNLTTLFLASMILVASAFRSQHSQRINLDRKPMIQSELMDDDGAGKRASITEKASTGYASTNGGTSGGSGGTVTTASTLAQFTAAVTNDTAPKIIIVSGTITGSTTVRAGSNKSIIGLRGAKLNGVGILISKQKNVIIRNIISAKVPASNGDGIGIQASSNVWIDHCELYSDLTHGKDYYDGLVGITHASEWITVSNSYFHDHWKASLVGHSDANGAEDKGHLHITYHNNYWFNIGSHTPSLRFGTGHIYNSYFENVNTGIESREGGQILLQSNDFVNVTDPINALYSDFGSYANRFENILGGRGVTPPVGTMTANSVPYNYSLLGSRRVKAAVVGTAGATLRF